MKLSIIIPYDRYEQYLYDCLESISEQNLDDFETLLIASKSAKIDQQIQEYPVNLKIITVEDGLNVAKKRNIGLENACGEYIYFIDWDDLSDAAREGRRIQARHLINRFNIEYIPKGE